MFKNNKSRQISIYTKEEQGFIINYLLKEPKIEDTIWIDLRKDNQ